MDDETRLFVTQASCGDHWKHDIIDQHRSIIARDLENTNALQLVRAWNNWTLTNGAPDGGPWKGRFPPNSDL